MITKDNYRLYEGLFADINKQLGYSDDNGIADIGDYFMELENIKSALDAGKGDRYWLIIPGDEELFEIDANSRSIKIPTEFSKNGIGVQGDHMAEVIYFSVDRYFDTTDLFNKEILVQYELPSGDKYLAKTINKTLKYQDNKVVFGWIVTGDMTEVAGNIKFAVRFYDRNDEKTRLLYSFSTLTATVKVNASLDFDIEAEDEIDSIVIDMEREYYNNLRASTSDNIAIPAAEPVFVDLSPDVGEELVYDISQIFSGRAKFDSNNLENKAMGSITYEFRYIDKNGNEKAPTNSTKLEYYEIDLLNETPNEYEAYYIEEKAGEQPYYVVYPYSDWEKNEDSRPEKLFKVKATLQPDKAGAYFLKAKNYAGRGNEIEVNSQKWYIAFAKEAIIDYINGLLEGTYEHQKIEQGGSVELKPGITSPDNGELTYQWLKDGKNISNANTASYIANEEGSYTIEVINKKNEDTTKITSEVMRVSYPPAAPAIDQYLANGEVKNNLTALKNVNTLKVTCKSIGAYSDEIRYQWYIVRDNEINPEGELMVGETSATLNVHEVGVQYYVKVINVYNTFTTEIKSNEFTVIS